jgi:hypothetical protein
MLRLLTTILLACSLSFTVSAHEGSFAPKLDIGRGGKCVEDEATMRSHHYELIRHQRDETMRKGIRGGKYSLADCVDCHASKKNNSVLGSSENFCQGCHEYAAVKPDCFECHSSKPRKAAGGAK